MQKFKGIILIFWLLFFVTVLLFVYSINQENRIKTQAETINRLNAERDSLRLAFINDTSKKRVFLILK